MDIYKRIYFLPIIIVVLTIISILPWSENLRTNFIIEFFVELLAIYAFLNIRNRFSIYSSKLYSFVNVYFYWILFCLIRGVYVAENYWEYKQLIQGAITLSLPIVVFTFSNPYILHITLKFWIKFALPLFILIIFLILYVFKLKWTFPKRVFS